MADRMGYLFINYTKTIKMQTKSVKLSVVLQLQPQIESTLNEAIRNYKSQKKNNPEVFDYINRLSNQIVFIKEAKDRGNAKKHSFFGKSNSFWIYTRSEIKRILDCSKDKNTTDKYAKQLANIDDRLEKFNTSTTVKLQIYPDLVKQFGI